VLKHQSLATAVITNSLSQGTGMPARERDASYQKDFFVG